MSSDRFRQDWFFGVKLYRHLLEAFYETYCYQQRYWVNSQLACKRSKEGVR